MDDAELTRLAIEEIVRGMEELKEPQVQERKINPIAKPNKRFLGRTLNSMISHNKRTNDRTQANCRRKLKELDERQKLARTKKSRSRDGSWELVLSSSADESYSKDARKRRKCPKTNRKKYKKSKKKSKSKKHKSNRRDSSSSTSSSGSSSESSSSTSNSYRQSKKSKHRKKAKHKKCQEDVETNPAEVPQMYYQSNINDAIQLDAALMADSYRQHQMQQLLYYSALMAGQESAEIEALKEELRTSDVEASDAKVEKTSVCSVVSSMKSSDSETGESGILQISLSSASSTSSKATENKILTKNRKNENDEAEESDYSNSSNDVIWNLDSDSSNDNWDTENNNSEEEQHQSDEDCICLTSESESGNDSESNNTTCESDVEIEKITTGTNEIGLPLTETVTLLSSSDSEVEIISTNGDDEVAQKNSYVETQNSTHLNTEQLQEFVVEREKSPNTEVSGQNGSPSIGNNPLIALCNTISLHSVENESVEKEAAEGLETKQNSNINISISESSSNVEETKQLEEVFLGSEPAIVLENTLSNSDVKDSIAIEERTVEFTQSANTSNISFSLSESTSTDVNKNMDQVKCHVADDTKRITQVLQPTEDIQTVNAECLSTLDAVPKDRSVGDFSKQSLMKAELNKKVVNATGEEEVDETTQSLLTSPHLDAPKSMSLSTSLPSARLLTAVAPVVTELAPVSTDRSNQSETNLTEPVSEGINL
uniref:G patch domain-containing protein 8 n=1 Tax=Ceratitis capitata TaxID=7213 RepID=W8BHF2_CERCA